MYRQDLLLMINRLSTICNSRYRLITMKFGDLKNPFGEYKSQIGLKSIYINI